MYKHVALLVRDPDTSHEAFVEHWQAEHAPVAREVEGVVKYATVQPVTPGAAEFDGLAESYFAELDALEDALEEDGAGVVDGGDADGFLDAERCRRFVGEVRVQRDDVGGDTDGLYKHSAFLVRQEGMSHEEFVDYWQSNHTPIAREIEGVVKYDTVLPTDPEHAEFDGVAELYFEELDALHDALGSEGSRDYDPEQGKAKEAREDVDNFLAVDERPRFIGRETVHEDEVRH